MYVNAILPDACLLWYIYPECFSCIRCFAGEPVVDNFTKQINLKITIYTYIYHSLRFLIGYLCLYSTAWGNELGFQNSRIKATEILIYKYIFLIAHVYQNTRHLTQCIVFEINTYSSLNYSFIWKLKRIRNIFKSPTTKKSESGKIKRERIFPIVFSKAECQTFIG